MAESVNFCRVPAMPSSNCRIKRSSRRMQHWRQSSGILRRRFPRATSHQTCLMPYLPCTHALHAQLAECAACAPCQACMAFIPLASGFDHWVPQMRVACSPMRAYTRSQVRMYTYTHVQNHAHVHVCMCRRYVCTHKCVRFRVAWIHPHQVEKRELKLENDKIELRNSYTELQTQNAELLARVDAMTCAFPCAPLCILVCTCVHVRACACV